MQQNTDLIELLDALNAAGARFLIAGGYAFAFYGRSRSTKDVDIFIGSDPENAGKIWDALVAFGAPLSDLRLEDLSTPETYFVMGREPNQIDIITSIDGVDFDAAWANRVESNYEGAKLWYLSKPDLIANKKASARPQDLADVAYLEAEE
jgi:hypothetical protein